MVRSDRKETLQARGWKMHLGGSLGRDGAILVQPTPGEPEDVNMVQAAALWRQGAADWRMVAGRLYPWANGGGAGGLDRFPTASLPAVLAPQGGVSPGAPMTGLRLERADARGSLAYFLTGPTRTATAMEGVVLGRTHGAERLDVSVASARSNGARTWRTLVTGEKRRGRASVLWGMLYGNGGGPRIGAGFVEADWQSARGGVALMRWNGIIPSERSELQQGVLIGAALPLDRATRLDVDLPLRRTALSDPWLTVRLRLVY